MIYEIAKVYVIFQGIGFLHAFLESSMGYEVSFEVQIILIIVFLGILGIRKSEQIDRRKADKLLKETTNPNNPNTSDPQGDPRQP